MFCDKSPYRTFITGLPSATQRLGGHLRIPPRSVQPPVAAALLRWELPVWELRPLTGRGPVGYGEGVGCWYEHKRRRVPNARRGRYLLGLNDGNRLNGQGDPEGSGSKVCILHLAQATERPKGFSVALSARVAAHPQERDFHAHPHLRPPG